MNMIAANTNNMITPIIVSSGPKFPIAFLMSSGIGAVKGKNVNNVTANESGLVINSGAA